ncbi:MAG: Fpg/Nei family DNA glycosylase [Geodermatophilaceae bacterium]|nr:Fpg/Nei family DNA glycosylase [Geodermatophilaceae bacterium]
MPEGDTVWLTARRLDQALAGRALTRAELRVPQLATTELAGETVREVRSRGKHILTRLESGTTLRSHLRMDGSWRIVRTGARWTGGPAHAVRAVLGNPDWECVGFRVHDLAVVPTAEEHTLVGHLGPDLLGPDWDPVEAERRLREQPEREIGSALLDQRNLAGIGNMYMAELLFLRGIDPWRPVGEVADVPALLRLAHRVLMRNREAPSQATTTGRRGDPEHWVYLRGAKPCQRCGTLLRGDLQGTGAQARTTYWCPTCQPAGRPDLPAPEPAGAAHRRPQTDSRQAPRS